MASMKTRALTQQKEQESEQPQLPKNYFIHNEGHYSHLASRFDSFKYAEVHNNPGEDKEAAQLPVNAT